MGGICIRSDKSPIMPKIIKKNKNILRNDNQLSTNINYNNIRDNLINQFELKNFQENIIYIALIEDKNIKIINDKIINNKDVYHSLLNIKNIIGKGTYNMIYDIDTNTEDFKDCVVSSYLNDIVKNQKYELIEKDYYNFFSQCEMHKILASEYKFVPDLKCYFIMTDSNNIYLCRIIEKLDIILNDFLKLNNKISQWLNLFIQISYKLIVYQNKYKFNHSDFKYTNIMAKYCDKKRCFV